MTISVKNEKLFKAALSIFNALILTLYIINYDISSRSFLALVYLALIFCLLALFTIRSSRKIFQYLQDIRLRFFPSYCFFYFLSLWHGYPQV